MLGNSCVRFYISNKNRLNGELRRGATIWEVEVESYKIFKNKNFIFVVCCTFYSKQHWAFLFIQWKHIKHKRIVFQIFPLLLSRKTTIPESLHSVWNPWIFHVKHQSIMINPRFLRLSVVMVFPNDTHNEKKPPLAVHELSKPWVLKGSIPIYLLLHNVSSYHICPPIIEPWILICNHALL